MIHAFEQAKVVGVAFAPDKVCHRGVVDRVVQPVALERFLAGDRQLQVKLERLGRLALVRVVADDGVDAQAANHNQVH